MALLAFYLKARDVAPTLPARSHPLGAPLTWRDEQNPLPFDKMQAMLHYSKTPWGGRERQSAERTCHETREGEGADVA